MRLDCHLPTGASWGVFCLVTKNIPARSFQHPSYTPPSLLVPFPFVRCSRGQNSVRILPTAGELGPGEVVTVYVTIVPLAVSEISTVLRLESDGGSLRLPVGGRVGVPHLRLSDFGDGDRPVVELGLVPAAMETSATFLATNTGTFFFDFFD